MSKVEVTYCDSFGIRLTEHRSTEPRLGEVLGIQGDDFEVRAVVVPGYWTDHGEINQYRQALVLIAPLVRGRQ